MMALFCVVATVALGVVVWKGPELRRWNWERDLTEDGVRLTHEDQSSDISLER